MENSNEEIASAITDLEDRVSNLEGENIVLQRTISNIESELYQLGRTAHEALDKAYAGQSHG